MDRTNKPIVRSASLFVVWLLGCAQAPGAVQKTATFAGTTASSNGREELSVQRVDIGGRALFIACEGVGHPTVMMETGSSDAGIVWGRALIRRVAEISRVCVYDRAGLGYSDPGEPPTDSGKVSAELQALLVGAIITPPYVLVGHSIGGMHVRVFAHDHPGEVSGVVLVDSSHPDQFVRAQERLGPEDWTRMLHSIENAWQDPSKEPLDWSRSSMLARETGSLGDRPLYILSHDPTVGPVCQGADCLSAEGHARWEALWQELQMDLAALSTRSSHLVVEGSGHYIQTQHPELVFDAIAQVVKATR
jgi:pimeloyl-ACP methyl ester carboxylesterase